MDLIWKHTTIAGRRVGPDDGCLYDGRHSVGRVHRDVQYDDRWNWSMSAFAGSSKMSGGQAASKEQAKALVEEAYAAFCQQPGAREAWQRHMDVVEASSAMWSGRQK